MAEKVIRYMEEKLRQKDSVVDKLRLKNATLKSQIQKVDLQLRQKEEMGDVLHYIDFHQLGIENKQYMAKIEERNQELLKLKMTTGNTVQVRKDQAHARTGVGCGCTALCVAARRFGRKLSCDVDCSNEPPLHVLLLLVPPCS